VYVAIVGEVVAVAVDDGALGGVILDGSECSFPCVTSGLPYALSLSPCRMEL